MTAVRAADLSVTRGGAPVLAGLDLAVDAGETVLLAGPSGSGKSTLLLALAGLLGSDPAAEVDGDLQVAGTDPRRASGPELARRVGVLFQRPRDQLLTLDVETGLALALDRLGVPSGDVDGRARDLLDRVGAAGLADRETATLSSGEAKRVALAHALAGDPDVLLLDEPLADLDPGGRDRLLGILEDVAGEAAVLVADHRRAALEPLADRVVGVRDGALGPPPGKGPDPPTWEEAPPEGPVLHVEGVAAAPGDEPVLAGLDLAVPPGLTCLTGPNGAGKTTLLRVVAGLLPPEAGRVRLGDDEVPEPTHERAALVGYAPQGPGTMFHRATVEAEIAWGADNLDVSCDPAARAEAHGLAAHRDRHPHTLSGGEAERLAWAAAHAHDPAVQLYDEPTTGLDPEARRVLARRVGRARQRGPVLVATHDPWLLAAADRVVELEDGAVAAAGSPEDLLAGDRLPTAGAAPVREVGR